MSQLIKKLKATQTQNTFVTPEAAAKIISFSAQKSKRKYRILGSILFTLILISGFYFSGFKEKTVQQAQKEFNPIASVIKISVNPLQASSETPLSLLDSYEDLISPTEVPNTPKSIYEQGASLYIKHLPECVPSLGQFISKYLDPHLKNYSQLAQNTKRVKKPHVAHKKTHPKQTPKAISLQDAIPIINSVQTPQENLLQERYNEQDDWIITAPKLSEAQQEHLNGIHNLLNHMQIESVREEGSQSRLKANGHIYHLNTLVSMKPRLTWIGIQHNELIFYDEYKQEYRKKITQN